MTAPSESVPDPASKQYKPQAYYLPVELHERFKAAWWATRGEPAPDGAGSMGAKVERLLEEECLRLEELYNQGEPFPPAPKRARGTTGEGTQRQRAFMERYWSDRREGAGEDPAERS